MDLEVDLLRKTWRLSSCIVYSMYVHIRHDGDVIYMFFLKEAGWDKENKHA